MTAGVRAAALSNFADVARQVGLNPVTALRRFGFDLAALREPDARVSAAAVAALLEYSAAESGCETFGLLMAQQRRHPNFGPLSLVLAHQHSLRDLLTTTAAHRTLLNDALTLTLEDCGDVVLVQEVLAIEGITRLRQSYELAIGILMRTCGSVLGSNWRPLSVHFSHGAPSNLDTHRRVFRTAVLFDCDFNGFLCGIDDIDRENPAADPSLLRYAERLLPNAGPVSAVGEVRRAIQVLIPVNSASVEKVAVYLGLGVRTLQRRLDEEGASFGRILTETRRELAQRHLAERQRSLTDVATLLGYSQLSSFTRWFSSEFGVTPTMWRKGSDEA